MTKPVIYPTLGRVVRFHPGTGVTHTAIITHVHSETMVNLAAFDSNGKAYSQTSVELVQAGRDAPEFSTWCEWMPFQQVQQKDQTINLTVTISPEIRSALERIILRIDKELQAQQ
jgi:hypothetical protein